MNSTDQLLLAGYMAKQAGVMQGAKNVADFGSYFIPGVGTSRMGYDAVKDFRQGNILGGSANLLGAGLTLIPGVGGFLGRGVGMLGRLGARGLARAGAPTLSRGIGALGKATGQGFQQMGNLIDRGVAATGRGLTRGVGRMGQIGQPLARGLTTVGQTAATRPGMTGLVGAGGVVGLHSAQSGINEGKAMQQQQQAGMQNFMNVLRQNSVMSNPMLAGGGYNPNFGY